MPRLNTVFSHCLHEFMEQQGVRKLNLWTMGTTCGTMLERKVSDLQW